MLKPWVLCSLVLLFFSHPSRANSQANAQAARRDAPYNLSVAVDEVILTFHATGADGLAIKDLGLDELSLLDNGKPPKAILNFQMLRDLPIRAGILIDTSASMQEYRSGDRAVAAKYAQLVSRRQTDQAFVMDFGRLSNLLQPWTIDAAALSLAIGKAKAGAESRMAGTAIFDAIFRACLYEFGAVNHGASGNFILLFSDGEDNASHASIKDAIDVCQRNNTAIYAFRSGSNPGAASTGPGTLAELASKTGGRVFHDYFEAEIENDLRTIEADLRNQYRMVFKPAGLKRDGAFHHIVLVAPNRVDSINIRSGYYAPAH